MATLGILLCDHVDAVWQPDFGDYDTMFIRLLSQADPTVHFRVYAVNEGDFPADTTTCDAWLITGSRLSAYDDVAWIQQLSDFIRRCNEQQHKLAGICFGHQLIAQALGGTTARAEQGWGVGLHTWQLQQTPPHGLAGDDTLSLLASHQDQVQILPPNATRVACSDFCPNAAMQIGEHILSFQGHPEFVCDYAKALMQSRTDRIPADTIQAGLASLHGHAQSDRVARWLVGFLVGDRVRSA
ncbi:MAG TPA: hypothetical protein DD979_14035 [Gammaproteobacteria bacterium]|nr:hypothetical protein [Gammaproteobacteria bacterium]